MSFFKAYDMRGTFGADFDLDTVYRVGRELPGVIGAKKFLIGRDCRQTSPAIAATLQKGLADAGAEVTDLGLATLWTDTEQAVLDTVDGRPYFEIVETARAFINSLGGFEKFAEWGLVR